MAFHSYGDMQKLSPFPKSWSQQLVHTLLHPKEDMQTLKLKIYTFFINFVMLPVSLPVGLRAII